MRPLNVAKHPIVDIEILCGCVSGRFRGSGRDAGRKVKGGT